MWLMLEFTETGIVATGRLRDGTILHFSGPDVLGKALAALQDEEFRDALIRIQSQKDDLLGHALLVDLVNSRYLHVDDGGRLAETGGDLAKILSRVLTEETGARDDSPPGPLAP